MRVGITTINAPRRLYGTIRLPTERKVRVGLFGRAPRQCSPPISADGPRATQSNCALDVPLAFFFNATKPRGAEVPTLTVTALDRSPRPGGRAQAREPNR